MKQSQLTTIRGKLARVASKRPMAYLFFTIFSALSSGMGLSSLLGPTIFHRLPFVFSIYVTTGSLLCAVLFGYGLADAASHKGNGDNSNSPIFSKQ